MGKSLYRSFGGKKLRKAMEFMNDIEDYKMETVA